MRHTTLLMRSTVLAQHARIAFKTHAARILDVAATYDDAAPGAFNFETRPGSLYCTTAHLYEYLPGLF